MNERIKELAGLALDLSVPETWTTLTAYELDKFTEKLAELLIKECIEVVHSRYMGDNNREDMEVLACVADLKDTFGVEK